MVYGDDFKDKTALEDMNYDCFKTLFMAMNIVSAKNLILPATTLTNNCYQEMFLYCTSLIEAPKLQSTTLANYCYYSMFNGCNKLNYIKCLAIDTGTYFTTDWVSGVSSVGTFVKHPNTTWSTGINGIPSGWTIENAEL